MYTCLVFICVQNFMLPACRPNFTEVARTTYKITNICLTDMCHIDRNCRQHNTRAKYIYMHIYTHTPRPYNNHHNTIKCFQIWRSFLWSDLIHVTIILYYFESNFQFFEIIWVNQNISSKFYLICQKLGIFFGNKVGWLST